MTPSPAPLSRLLLEDRLPGAPVCVGSPSVRTWAGFLDAIRGLSSAIRSRGGSRWLVACDSCFEFAAGLFAVWHASGVAVLPPNLQEGSLRELASGLAGTVGDGSARIDGLPHLSAAEPGEGPPLAGALDRTRPALELYTSGSTGGPRAIPKSLAQLEDEIEVLELTWGPALEGATAIATVSGQHIYGLLFRLLWPLAAGRPFGEPTLFHWEEVLAAVAANVPCYLVTSPAHLIRLPDLEDHPGLERSCGTIFSSGGLLPAAAAAHVREAFGHTPIEVLGSTETGGVGWRRQERGGEAWRPLSGVEVTLDDERLRVVSPFVSVPDRDGGFTMGDRGRLHPDGGFALLGRADRIVKIAEKRVSLATIEERLGSHSDVAEAAVLTLRDEPGVTPRIAAVVVPTGSGREILDRDGNRAMNRRLRDALAGTVERVALPRYFRYVRALPRNPVGKIPVADLRRLFERSTGVETDEPERLSQASGPGRLELRLRVPENLRYLDGHFDRFPVVAGVVQLEWVAAAAAELLGGRLEIARMERVKFHNLIRPGQSLTLRVEHDAKRSRINYCLDDGDVRFASGRLVLSS